MSNNSGSCKIVRFEAAEKVDENLQNFAEDFFDVTAIDYTDDGKEQLVGYLKADSNNIEIEKYAQTCGIKLPGYQSEILQSDDWLKDNVIEFSPVEVADFLVYGIHEKNIDIKNKIGIKIYAATAFGSEHQTTKCCLEALSHINKTEFRPRNILDVGTGSGILAIAAAKLWTDTKVIAVDIDDEAVSVSSQNTKDNNVESQIICAYSDGYQSDIVQKNAPYDIILANILARPLIAMAEDMAKNLANGGYAIISGFIDNQDDWVIGEHEKHGLKLQKIYQADNWRAALLKKE